MSFSITESEVGVVRLAIDGALDGGAIYVLRLELANLLRGPVRPVDLSMTRPDLLGDAVRVLLLSFFELLDAQGGALVVSNRGIAGVLVADVRHLERLLKGQTVPATSLGRPGLW